MRTVPLLFLGGDLDPLLPAALYLAESERATADGWAEGSAPGAPFELAAESAGVAPAGEDGECIYAELWLTVTHRAAVQLKLTPILDGTRLGDDSVHNVVLEALPARRTVQLAGLPLRVPAHRPGGGVWGYFAPRGGRLAVRIESEGGAGDVVLDAVVVAYEVVQESRT